MKALARKHTVEAVQRLAQWLRSDNPKASVSAAIALLDRGYGKPAQSIVGDADAAPVEMVIRWSSDPPPKS